MLAWIETDAADARSLAPYIHGRAGPDASEAVTITQYEPQRVELTARLERPGIVVLADLYYPGWTLTIDGHPAPILRANRLMRRAAVAAGTHRLVYRYDPASFRIGGLASLLSIGLVLVLGARGAIRDARGNQLDAYTAAGSATAVPWSARGGRPGRAAAKRCRGEYPGATCDVSATADRRP